MSKFHSVFFLFLFLVSCHYFEKPIPSEEELFQKRIKEIDWNEVTNYPSVAECDSILDKEEQKACFFDFLSKIIHQKMVSDSLSIRAEIIDTIDVSVTIFPDATLSFEPIFKKDSVSYDKHKIDSLIKVRLTDFPKIEPALKEGIPVKTQFILPVILKME
jgi:hypothetical protein